MYMSQSSHIPANYLVKIICAYKYKVASKSTFLLLVLLWICESFLVFFKPQNQSSFHKFSCPQCMIFV